MTSRMTPAEDRQAVELKNRGWSHRRIAEHMGRTHRSIGAAIRRHELRVSAPSPVPEKLEAQMAGFWAWVDEGRRKKYLDKLIRLIAASEEGD